MCLPGSGIDSNAILELANTSVGAIVESVNTVPVVVESEPTGPSRVSAVRAAPQLPRRALAERDWPAEAAVFSAAASPVGEVASSSHTRAIRALTAALMHMILPIEAGRGIVRKHLRLCRQS